MRDAEQSNVGKTSSGPTDSAHARSTRNAVVGLLAIVVLGLSGGFLWWQGRSGPANSDTPPPPSDGRAIAATPMFSSNAIQLAPGIYMLGRLYPAVSYVIETSDGFMLVDTGIETDAQLLVKQLEELGLSLNSLRLILLTHVHGDHSLGAQRLRQLTGAKVYAGRGDTGHLRQGGPREAFFALYPQTRFEPHPTTVDVELEGGEIIVLGDTRVQAIAAPGHTPGSICYLLQRDGMRYLLSGDTICSLISDICTYASYLPPRYLGNARDYLATFRNLRELPKPDMVLPGHPNEERISHSPLVGNEQWHQLLDTAIQSMQLLVERHDADGRDFLDGHAKELLPGLHYLGDIRGFSMYALKSQAGIFLFDAPGGTGLMEFLEKRFVEIGWELSSVAGTLLTTADYETTTGLPLLIEKTGCAVVTSRDAFAQLSQRCPTGTTFLAPQDLVSEKWFDVSVIPIGGLSSGTVTYGVSWHGKSVFVSGFIPINSFDTMKRFTSFLAVPANTASYLSSVQSLASIQPDLWLPLRPKHGKNANLYDDDWEQVIAKSAQLVRETLHEARLLQ